MAHRAPATAGMLLSDLQCQGLSPIGKGREHFSLEALRHWEGRVSKMSLEEQLGLAVHGTDVWRRALARFSWHPEVLALSSRDSDETVRLCLELNPNVPQRILMSAYRADDVHTIRARRPSEEIRGTLHY